MRRPRPVLHVCTQRREIVDRSSEGAELAFHIDALHLDLQRPLAVKIDTQGAEPNIFAGGRETLAKADLIAFEFWPYAMRRIGGDVSQMIDFVADTFAEGSIAVDDMVEDMTWRPIKAICAELRHVATDPITMDNYFNFFDVIVRKQLR